MYGEHSPRLWKAIATVCLGVAMSALAVLVKNETAFWVVFLAGLAFIVLGFVEALMANLKYIYDVRENQYHIQLRVIEALTNADAEARNAIGVKLPQFNFVYCEEPGIFWQDTDVPYQIFKEFLQESSDQHTAPERDWKARGVVYHRYWMQIYNKLVEMGLVLEQSAAGSHSQLWKGSGYKRAWSYWGRLPGQLKELE